MIKLNYNFIMIELGPWQNEEDFVNQAIATDGKCILFSYFWNLLMYAVFNIC